MHHDRLKDWHILGFAAAVLAFAMAVGFAQNQAAKRLQTTSSCYSAVCLA